MDEEKRPTDEQTKRQEGRHQGQVDKSKPTHRHPFGTEMKWQQTVKSSGKTQAHRRLSVRSKIEFGHVSISPKQNLKKLIKEKMFRKIDYGRWRGKKPELTWVKNKKEKETVTSGQNWASWDVWKKSFEKKWALSSGPELNPELKKVAHSQLGFLLLLFSSHSCICMSVCVCSIDWRPFPGRLCLLLIGYCGSCCPAWFVCVFLCVRTDTL